MAKVFYDRKYFDGWGTEIIKIFDLCRANDIPEPEYEQYSGGVEIRFKFRESIGFAKPPRFEFSEYQLTMRQKNILKILIAGKKMTVGEITESMENPPSACTVGDDLSHLKELGLAKFEGVGRGVLGGLPNKKRKNNGARMGRNSPNNLIKLVFIYQSSRK